MTTFQPEDVFLAAEVVSPESADRDRDTKPRKYAAAGIRHFWRVEKDADDGDRAVVHTFEPEPATGVYVPTGVFRDRLKVADPFPIDIDLTEIQPLGPPALGAPTDRVIFTESWEPTAHQPTAAAPSRPAPRSGWWPPPSP